MPCDRAMTLRSPFRVRSHSRSPQPPPACAPAAPSPGRSAALRYPAWWNRHARSASGGRTHAARPRPRPGHRRLPQLLRRPARPALAEAAQRRLRPARRPGRAAPGTPCSTGSRRPRRAAARPAAPPSATSPRPRPSSTVAARVLPAYRRHHADLLAHLADDGPVRPLLPRPRPRGRPRTCAAGRRVAAPSTRVVARLNDFVGYRPVAMLETRPQGEPYEHERHRPLPLYLAGAGVALGPLPRRHRPRPSRSCASTDAGLLARGRASTSTCSTSWPSTCAPTTTATRSTAGPTTSSASGTRTTSTTRAAIRRYVVRKITLDALHGPRSSTAAGRRRADERLSEAAAVLAGTILMAAGVSGWGPAAHDSTTTPGHPAAAHRPLPRCLLRAAAGAAARRRTPSGCARGAGHDAPAVRRRPAAPQRLPRPAPRHAAAAALPGAAVRRDGLPRRQPGRGAARIPARVGAAAQRRSSAGSPPGRRAVRAGPARRGGRRSCRRSRTCCAAASPAARFADPWNILGFQGLFPLSPAREDTIRDPRSTSWCRSSSRPSTSTPG